MWFTLSDILIILGYVLVGFIVSVFTAVRTINFNPYLRLFILSFVYAAFWGIGIAGSVYAAFWGIGIAGSDGHPGFALPVPNIVAITMMAGIGFYRGVITGLYIFVFWWIILFTVLLIRYLIKRRKRLQLHH